MNTTAFHFTEDLKTLIETAVDAALEQDAEDFRDDLLNLIDMEEEDFLARFGADAAPLIDIEITGDVETVETCCVTFDCPGERIDVGSIEITLGHRSLASVTIHEDVDWLWRV